MLGRFIFLMSRHLTGPVRDSPAEGAALLLGCLVCTGPDHAPRHFSAPHSNGLADGLTSASETPGCPAIKLHKFRVLCRGNIITNKYHRICRDMIKPFTKSLCSGALTGPSMDRRRVTLWERCWIFIVLEVQCKHVHKTSDPNDRKAFSLEIGLRVSKEPTASTRLADPMKQAFRSSQHTSRTISSGAMYTASQVTSHFSRRRFLLTSRFSRRAKIMRPGGSISLNLSGSACALCRRNLQVRQTYQIVVPPRSQQGMGDLIYDARL